jgi:hypothetical protein
VVTLTNYFCTRHRVNITRILILWSLLLGASCTRLAPRIALSREKVFDRGFVEMTGTGFTPKQSIISHLKRPDGTEFPGLRLLTDEKGEFAHKINTYDLQHGIHQVWVIDSNGVSSNIATFEVAQ